jgi:hypothetical protein
VSSYIEATLAKDREAIKTLAERLHALEALNGITHEEQSTKDFQHPETYAT